MTVGLTGGIGSGKSIVAAVFELLGCAVFNSDEEAKASYYDEGIRAQVIQLLGEVSYTGEALNKKFVAEAIFADEKKRAALNAIIHPAVKKRMLRFETENKGRIIVKESALLLEAGLEKEMDSVVVVVSPDELRIKRIMQRDGLPETAVRQRLASQLSQEKKAEVANYVITNDEKNLLIPQIISVYQKLKENI